LDIVKRVPRLQTLCFLLRVIIERNSRYLLTVVIVLGKERPDLTGDLKGEAAIEPEATLELLPRGFCATRGMSPIYRKS